MYDGQSNNFEELLRELKREARCMRESPAAREVALDRPVNALGSTAREMARGDIFSGMERGVSAGKPEAILMAKMYGAKVATPPRPVNWMPWLMGYQDARNGKPHLTRKIAGGALAPEYMQGYQYGEFVNQGIAEVPSWIKENGPTNLTVDQS
jgi:hypothetical protein